MGLTIRSDSAATSLECLRRYVLIVGAGREVLSLHVQIGAVLPDEDVGLYFGPVVAL
jgi:hypothetical protein